MTMRPENAAPIDTHAADISWMPSMKNESPNDTAYRKLYQAEMLCKTLYGESGEAFRTLNDVIQDGVLWLLSDLLTEAREARETAQKTGAVES